MSALIQPLKLLGWEYVELLRLAACEHMAGSEKEGIGLERGSEPPEVHVAMISASHGWGEEVAVDG